MQACSEKLAKGREAAAGARHVAGKVKGLRVEAEQAACTALAKMAEAAAVSSPPGGGGGGGGTGVQLQLEDGTLVVAVPADGKAHAVVLPQGQGRVLFDPPTDLASAKEPRQVIRQPKNNNNNNTNCSSSSSSSSCGGGGGLEMTMLQQCTQCVLDDVSGDCTVLTSDTVACTSTLVVLSSPSPSSSSSSSLAAAAANSDNSNDKNSGKDNGGSSNDNNTNGFGGDVQVQFEGEETLSRRAFDMVVRLPQGQFRGGTVRHATSTDLFGHKRLGEQEEEDMVQVRSVEIIDGYSVESRVREVSFFLRRWLFVLFVRFFCLFPFVFLVFSTTSNVVTIPSFLFLFLLPFVLSPRNE
jgi:hypothetical protein